MTRAGEQAVASALAELGAAGISAASTYDGLIGLTARAHGALLFSRDQRAARAYRALAVPFELLER